MWLPGTTLHAQAGCGIINMWHDFGKMWQKPAIEKWKAIQVQLPASAKPASLHRIQRCALLGCTQSECCGSHQVAPGSSMPAHSARGNLSSCIAVAFTSVKPICLRTEGGWLSYGASMAYACTARQFCLSRNCGPAMRGAYIVLDRCSSWTSTENLSGAAQCASAWHETWPSGKVIEAHVVPCRC